jgi:hypothetical protein
MPSNVIEREALGGADAAENAVTRRCGRCLGEVGVSGIDAISVSDWWVCRPCRGLLIPGSVR